MKKILLLLSLYCSGALSAQLADGTIAPDFTITDIDGETHHLYEYLQAGKTVYIDFWASHCPYCWAYHNQGHVEDLYTAHGPAGSQSQDVVVLGIEVDSNNGLNEFNGVSGITQGNWLAGISYPVLNPEGAALSQITGAYEVNFYPLVYAICPDGTLNVTGTQTAAVLYEEVDMCAVTTAVESNYPTDALRYFFSSHTSTFTVLNSKQGTALRIFDLTGKVVHEMLITDTKSIVVLQKVSSGIYFCQFTDQAGHTITGKFYVE